MRHWWSRLGWALRSGWRRRQLDQDLDEEMRFHLEMLETDEQSRGTAPAEARLRARRAFGNTARITEETRGVWGWPLVEALAQDVRFALRAFRRDWPSTTAAVGALALGTGLAIAVFTLVSAVLLRPLPYHQPERLVMIWAVNEQQGWNQEKMVVPDMLEFQRSGLFQSVVGFHPSMSAITGPGASDLTHGYAVTPGFLPLLGVQPLLGRGFSAEEDSPAGDKRRVLLRHSFWMRRYGGDPSVIGQSLFIEREPYTIVGVMGPEFQFFNRQTDLFVPTRFHPTQITGRGRMLRVVARLADGVTLEQAQAQADVMAARFAREHPDTNRGWHVRLAPVPADSTGEVRPALWVLMAAVAMVLLIACANVANLLLAQGIARNREIALRTALGAGRGRLLRQLLTESLLLAVMGGALGYALAHLAVHLFQNTLPAQYSHARHLIQMERIRIDGWVALFSAVIVPLVAALFGMVPAWRGSRTDLNESLKESGRGSSGSAGARRLQSVLVAGQLALAVVLASGAVLLARSFERLYQQGPGFRPDHIKSMYMALPVFEHPTRNQEERMAVNASLHQRALERVRHLPGIEGAGTVAHLPLAGFYYLAAFEVEGQGLQGAGDRASSVHAIDRYVSNSYHELLEMPLRQGRYFQDQDRPGSAKVMVVNEQFAARYMQGGPVVGRRIRYANNRSAARDESGWHTVVGVVSGERAGGMDEEPRPMIYLSMDQTPWTHFHLMVKAPRMDVPTTVRNVTRELQRISPSIAPYEIRSFDDLVLDSTWRVRYSMMLLTALSGVALVLSALGVYGLLSYGVRKRTREIGIRMALGAQRATVLRLVTTDGLKLAAAGIAVGIVGACVLTRFLSSLLFGVRPIEPVLFAAVAVGLALVVLVACLAPAWRAAAVEPVRALRAE